MHPDRVASRRPSRKVASCVGPVGRAGAPGTATGAADPGASPVPPDEPGAATPPPQAASAAASATATTTASAATEVSAPVDRWVGRRPARRFHEPSVGCGRSPPHRPGRGRAILHGELDLLERSAPRRTRGRWAGPSHRPAAGRSSRRLEHVEGVDRLVGRIPEVEVEQVLVVGCCAVGGARRGRPSSAVGRAAATSGRGEPGVSVTESASFRSFPAGAPFPR